MATSSKRAYAILKSAAPRTSVPVEDHGLPVPPQEMLKHSFVSISVGFLGRQVINENFSYSSTSGKQNKRFQ